MQIEQVLEMVKEAAEEKKAQNPIVLDIRGLSVVADYFVLCHGNSETQVQSIADELMDKAQKMGLTTKPMEGYHDARWVLLDLGDVIVHVFHKEDREYYHLEKLWADANQTEMR